MNSATKRIRRSVVTCALLILGTSPLSACGVAGKDGQSSLAKASSDLRAESDGVAQTPGERLRQSCLSPTTDAAGAAGGQWPARTAQGAMIVSDRNADLEQFDAPAEEAAQAVRSTLTRTSKHTLLVLLPHTAQQYEAWAKSSSRRGKIAETVTKPGCLPYIVISPDLVDRPSSTGLRETLVHEAVHALTLSSAAANRPLWVNEGMAEYIGQKTVSLPGHPDPQMKRQVPTDADLTGADASLAYDAAWQFYVFLADSYGEDKVVEFYQAMTTTPVSVDQAMRTIFGADLSTLDYRYRQAG